MRSSLSATYLQNGVVSDVIEIRVSFQDYL